MLAQNPISVILETPINEENEIPQCRAQLIYRNLVRKISNSPVFKRIVSLQNRSLTTSQSLCNGKSITAKMRAKLITWLQKLSFQTFEFSTETLLTAIKILDEYLCLSNPSPKVLQLTGCACLYLAAKMREVTIVAGQCYVAAAGGCFTEDELTKKELDVFQTLGFNTTFSSMSRVYKLINQRTIEQKNGYKLSEVEGRLVDIARSLELREWQEHRVLCMFVALASVGQRLPQVSELVQMLKVHSAF